MVNSKQKGAEFERDICRALSRWVTHDEREDCFWRSAMSGGRATVAFKKGKDVRQAGDITANAREGHILTDHWYIECKHLKDLMFDRFALEGFGLLHDIWLKTREEAKKYDNRHPMLIARQNFHPTIVINFPTDITRYCLGGIIRPGHEARCHGRTFEVWDFEQLMQRHFTGES